MAGYGVGQQPFGDHINTIHQQSVQADKATTVRSPLTHAQLNRQFRSAPISDRAPLTPGAPTIHLLSLAVDPVLRSTPAPHPNSDIGPVQTNVFVAGTAASRSRDVARPRRCSSGGCRRFPTGLAALTVRSDEKTVCACRVPCEPQSVIGENLTVKRRWLDPRVLTADMVNPQDRVRCFGSLLLSATPTPSDPRPALLCSPNRRLPSPPAFAACLAASCPLAALVPRLLSHHCQDGRRGGGGKLAP